MLELKSTLMLMLSVVTFGATPLYAGKFKCFDAIAGHCVAYRYRVPTGWLVKLSDNPEIESKTTNNVLTFVPDPDHKWKD